MSRASKYFVLSSQHNNFTDFGLSFSGISTVGEFVAFVGSSNNVDSIFVRPGTIIDFSESDFGSDRIYLDGNYAEYTFARTGGVMTATRGVGASLERVSFVRDVADGVTGSDLLIFSDGTRNAFDIYENIKNSKPMPPAGNERSTSVASFAAGLSASIKAFAIGSEGTTFASPSPGVSVEYVGGTSVDTVYVSDGATIDASGLGEGTDCIYFRGNWADYSKSRIGSILTFERTVNAVHEVVRVVGYKGAYPNERDARDDQLIFADGSVSSGEARVAISISPTVALDGVAGVDRSRTTPGLGPSILSSALDNVTNLDPGSNLVLVFGEPVVKGSGKSIHLLNTGGVGFHGEATARDVLIPLDSSQVLVEGNRVIINPSVDLDLANSYVVKIDAGAFVGLSSGRASLAFDGTSLLNFSTVTPGVSSNPVAPNASDAAPSQRMAVDGEMLTGPGWLDIEGLGSPLVRPVLELSGNDVVLITKDYRSEGGDAVSDGIWSHQFNLKISGFGSGDVIYIDNQSFAPNDLSNAYLLDLGAGTTSFRFTAEPEYIGGRLDVSFAGYASGFELVEDIRPALQFDYDPVVSDGIVKPAVDTTPPTILTSSALSVSENGFLVSVLEANEQSTWALVGGTDIQNFSLSGSELSFKVAPNFEVRPTAPYLVQVAATDVAGNQSNSTTLSISVTDLNEPPAPVGSVGTQTATVNQPFSLSLAGKFSDPDGATTSNGTLTYTLNGTLPQGLSFNASTQSISGTPTAATAAASFTLTATDAGSPNLLATQTFTLGVSAAVAVTGFSVTDSNGSNAHGKGGDPLTFRLTTSEPVNVTGAPTATFSVGTGTVVAQYGSGTASSTLTFVGTAPATGNGNFTLSAINLNGGTIAAVSDSARTLATSVVGQVNSSYTLDNVLPTLIATSPVSVDENTTAVTPLTASEPVAYSALGTSGDSTFFTLENGVLRFNTPQNFEQTSRSNTYSVPITFTDSAGNVNTQPLSIELQNVNEPVSAISDANPAANSVRENSLVGTTVGYTASALDPDANNAVTYRLFTTASADVEFPSNLLRIDSLTGVMSVGGPIDYEALPANAKFLSVYIKATSTDGSFSVTGSPVTIIISDEVEATVPLTLSSAPVISSNSATIVGTTTPSAVVKVFIGTSDTAVGQVTADSQGGWSIPINSTSLVSGTNAFKFTATLGTSFGTLNQNFLYSGAPSWTQGALTVPSIRTAVDLALASDSKITHTEAVSVLNAAIDAAKANIGANGKVGSQVLTDLRAISLRGDGVFTSTDLTGKESGYLSYVFDKIVNTSTANAFYTGGTITRQALGNLSADSPIADLEKLRDKWLLGLDTPDPRTQGDTANPEAAAASGEYATFNEELVIDGFNAFDVRQGSMGDCYLLAGAAAIAETETYAKTSSSVQLAPYKNAFEQVFVANPAGASPTWGVRFFDEFGKAHWVTVNNKLVVPTTGATTPSYAKVVVPAGATQGEMWVPLLEKAYAQANEIGIFGRDNSSNAFFAIEGGLGEGIPQLMGGGMAFISTVKTTSWSRLYFGLPAADATAAAGAGTYEGVSNTGQPLFLASFIQLPIDGKIEFTPGHAYMTYDAARTTASNTTVSVYNPWGESSASSNYVSPFQANLATLKTNPDVMLMFRVSDVPAWVTTAFNNQQTQKAASAAPASVASVLQSAVSGVVSGDFLKVTGGASAAYSDNGTPNATSIADDRHGLFTLDGTETGFKVFLLPKTGTSTAGFDTLLQSIQASDSAATFSAAVTAAQSQAEVRFGLARGQVDITGDATAETGVTVALKYSGIADGKITFAPLREIGEVASAKVEGGVSASITHTKPHPEAHAVYFDSQSGAVMFLDSQGYWKVGKFGDPISSYKFLTYENTSGTGTLINSDTFEAEADAVQFIFGANGTTVVGYELIASSHENPDDLFTLYFDQNGRLAGSEFLSASEELEAEAEYDFDVNGSGGVGQESSFLAEGIGGAPDLYVDPYGDLILARVDNHGAIVVVAPITIAYEGDAYPLNLYDFEDGIEVTAVVPIPDSTDYLLYLQFGTDAIATVTVHQDGSILLGTGDHAGEIVIGGTLTPEQEAELESAEGIDLGRDGDTDVQAPLVTGDASDQTFDSRDEGTNDWFQDSAGDDTYFTGEGDDLLIGIHSGESSYATRGDNTFHGGEGDDTFVGIGDGDVFFGGPDTDSVWISGAPNDYSIFIATPAQLEFARAVDPGIATGYVIADIDSGALSAVFDVESIEFGFDGTTGLLSNLATNYTHVG